MSEQPASLDDVLGNMAAAGEGDDRVSLGEMLDCVGQRSFGPFVLIFALLAFTPFGGIPGVPTALAMMTILIVAQLLAGANHVWLPEFVLKRNIGRKSLTATIARLRPVARSVDRVTRPRLTWMLKSPIIQVAALGCIVVALTIPPLEVVPFAGTVSWAAIAAFALAVVARDGILLLVAILFAFGAGYMVYWAL